MSRLQSKEIMGFLSIELKHYPALLALVQPANPTVRLLDPFAGKGAFLDVAAQAWNVTPYANELDGERAQRCIARFGATQAVLIARKLVDGKLWDGESPIRIDDVYVLARKMKYLTERDLSLFKLTDFVEAE